MNCWFCRTGAARKPNGTMVGLQPDGKPICRRCRALLMDFLDWLHTGLRTVP